METASTPDYVWLESLAARKWALAVLRQPTTSFPVSKFGSQCVALRKKLGRLIARLEDERSFASGWTIFKLEIEIGKVRVLLAPVRRVPIEVLQIIFRLTGQADYPVEPPLSLVSTLWRDVALSTPCLWSKINVTDRDIASDRRLLQWVSRAKEEPLSLSLNFGDKIGLKDVSHISQLLRRHLPCLQSFESYGDSTYLEHFNNMLQSSRLRHVTVAPPGVYPQRTNTYYRFPVRAKVFPVLQYMHLRQFQIKGLLPISAPSLTTLKLDGLAMETRNFLAMLLEALSLDTLEISSMVWIHDVAVSDLVVVGLQLKKLRYKPVLAPEIPLLTKLIMSSRNLKELSLGLISGRFIPPTTLESHPSMESVELLLGKAYHDAMQDIESSRRLDWVFKFTSLARLKLIWCGPIAEYADPETEPMVDIRPIISRLAALEDGKHLLPKLEHLSLQSWLVDVRPLLNLLKKRLAVKPVEDKAATSRNCTLSLKDCSRPFNIILYDIIPQVENASFHEFSKLYPTFVASMRRSLIEDFMTDLLTVAAITILFSLIPIRVRMRALEILLQHIFLLRYTFCFLVSAMFVVGYAVRYSTSVS